MSKIPTFGKYGHYCEKQNIHRAPSASPIILWITHAVCLHPRAYDFSDHAPVPYRPPKEISQITTQVHSLAKRVLD